jgi:hypothetical protein
VLLALLQWRPRSKVTSTISFAKSVLPVTTPLMLLSPLLKVSGAP